jgi:hypothetical protein
MHIYIPKLDLLVACVTTSKLIKYSLSELSVPYHSSSYLNFDKKADNNENLSYSTVAGRHKNNNKTSQPAPDMRHKRTHIRTHKQRTNIRKKTRRTQSETSERDPIRDVRKRPNQSYAILVNFMRTLSASPHKITTTPASMRLLPDKLACKELRQSVISRR